MRHSTFRLAALFGFAALIATAAVPARAQGFADVLDTPASASALASQRPLMASQFAGERLVAAGLRGHIVYSDDGGKTWQQASVPVSSDLTALSFADARHGWAVGHDGVILHSEDGGKTWQLQMDGRRVNALVLAGLKRRIAAEGESETLAAQLAEAERAAAEGPARPFLDVWFADAREGYAVGAYNLILHTVDGGATWESWFDRTENPRFYHLYGIRGEGENLYAVGELGLVLRLDRASGQFRALATPYHGSFFGVLANPGLVLAYGMRGNAYRSRDQGATWEAVATGSQSSLTGSTVLADGRPMLCSQGGELLLGDAEARQFQRLPSPAPMSYTGLAASGTTLVVTGLRGVRAETPSL